MYTLSSLKIIEYCFIVLYLTFIILMAGIDKENRKIDKLVAIYGVVISIIYMVYLCIVEKTNIYRYVIYLVAYIVILIFDTVTLKKYAKNKYVNGILSLVVTMVVFTGEYITANSIIWTLLAISIYMLIYIIKEKRNRNRKTDKQIANEISVGFYLGLTNIAMFLMALLYTNYIL